jgi:hypothetical protein
VTQFLGRYPIRRVAWINVVVHFAGLVLAAIGIRPGSPLVSLPERLSYLADKPPGWALGWITWICCAIALIAFLAVLTQRLRKQSGLAELSLMIAIAGAALDLSCDAIYAIAVPMLAAWQPPVETLFLTVERVTGIVSLAIANGAYSVAILLFTMVLQGRREFGALTVGIGYGVGGFGLLLAAAGFTGVPWHAAWATVPTIGLYCLWVILVARSLEPAGSRS